MARITADQLDALLADTDADHAEDAAVLAALREQAQLLAERIAQREARLTRRGDTVAALRALKADVANPKAVGATDG